MADEIEITVPVLKPGYSTNYRSEWSNDKFTLPEPILYGENVIEPKDAKVTLVNYQTTEGKLSEPWTIIWVHLLIDADLITKPIDFRPKRKVIIGPPDAVTSRPKDAVQAMEALKALAERAQRLQEQTPDEPDATI